MNRDIQKQIIIQLDDLGVLFSQRIEQAQDCPHKRRYHAFLAVCDTCEHSIPCSWLSENASAQVAHRKPVKFLAEELQFACDALLADIGRTHSTSTCTCDYCEWLRASRELLQNPSVSSRL